MSPLVVGKVRQSSPIGPSLGGVESGRAKVILNEVRLRDDLFGINPLDVAGRFPAPSPSSKDRQ
jgi:hypothetical protein